MEKIKNTLQELKDQLAKGFCGMTSEEAQSQDKCVTCGEDITEFRDELSISEYRISGMCQKCQDGEFGE